VIHTTKKYLKLTDEQKAKGVIFSSCLKPGNTVHEVLATDEDKNVVIKRLLNDSFFNHSPFKYNEVRQ